MDIASIRREYQAAPLLESAAAADPIVQFQTWFGEVLRAEVPEPNAMTLATVGADGMPAARIVLLKDVDARGFTFFTNYQSAKGRELAQHPQAALVFFWQELARQVRVEGTVSPVSEAESDAYFASRPRGSQLGAWASPQSATLAARDVLERRLAEVEARFDGQPVPRPPHWGGYRLQPRMVEFWHGRPSRLHDRLRYTRASGDAGWKLERLGP